MTEAKGKGSYQKNLSNIMGKFNCDRERAKVIYQGQKGNGVAITEGTGQESIAGPAAQARASEVVAAAEALLAKAGGIEKARKALNYLSDEE
jgi:hypothetical protein